ncbi:MAG: stage II sporulation protein M [Firmicutes bacterium]|jgi:stage II sporulation protein M|nr:stage II sporulation protein M [Bacillota bacterium]
MARQISGAFQGYFHRRTAAYMFVFVVFIMGTISGAFAVKALSTQQRDDLGGYIHTLFEAAPAANAVGSAAAIRQAFLQNIAKTVGLMWLLGLSVLGAPLVLALLFLRGFVLGFTVGFMVEEMVLKGIAMAVVSVVPHNLLVVPALILAGGAALSFSWAALRTLMGRRDINMYHQFFRVTLLTVGACGLMGAAALVEAYITPVLIETASRYL